MSSLGPAADHLREPVMDIAATTRELITAGEAMHRILNDVLLRPRSRIPRESTQSHRRGGGGDTGLHLASGIHRTHLNRSQCVAFRFTLKTAV